MCVSLNSRYITAADVADIVEAAKIVEVASEGLFFVLAII
jgi:hypothetical protein